jgi:DNA polymerase-3 subunit epsilon
VTRGPAKVPSAVKRAGWRSALYASLDFELTGLDLRNDRIISFGVVPVDGSRIEVGRSVYELVDPGEVQMSRKAVTIHGLRPVDVRGTNPAEAGRRSLDDALGGRILITWFATVEASFLGKLYGTRTKPWLRRCIDVRVLVMRLLGNEAQGMTLEQAAERFGVPVASPHHALDDALVTAQLFLVVATKLEAAGVGTTRELIRLGRPTSLRPLEPAWRGLSTSA